ncbi:MAG: hypothetical protein KJO69_00385 [Gammaproteobacteria bacterium]|nr:hypothetical protein [Gammaproteobacteria bacterium]NNJ73120.1 hypothetical protein [Enterobacterales bacterium]
MKSTTRLRVLLFLILAALGSYSIGFARGVMIFIIAGIIFELAFWIGLFRTKQNNIEE